MQHKRRSRWQAGQALIEYTVLIPIGIAAIIAGVAIGSVATFGLEDTVEAFDNPPASTGPIDGTDDDPLDPGSEVIAPGDDGEDPEDVECVPPSATLPNLGGEGAKALGLGNHTVELVSYQYPRVDDVDGRKGDDEDPNEPVNETLLIYRVTPSDSKKVDGNFDWWALGIADAIWEQAGSDAGPNQAGPWKNSQNPIPMAGLKFTGSYHPGAARDFWVVLPGQYTFGDIIVGVKTTTMTKALVGTVQGPIERIDNVCQ